MILFSAKYKKRLLSAVLCGSMLLTAGASAFASEPEEVNTEDTAAIEIMEEAMPTDVYSAAMLASNSINLSDAGYALKRLGLVLGDDNGDLMLSKSATRAEALTLFVRMCGEAQTAESAAWSYTFRDVPTWTSNVVGYSVYKGYTNGYSETEFAADDAVTLEHFMTFVLRALGYNDFDWSQSCSYAVALGVCTQDNINTWKSSAFRRQQMMEISYLALSANLKGSNATMADKLISAGQISAAGAAQEGIRLGSGYTAQDTSNGGGSNVNVAYVSGGEYTLYNVGTGTVMTANAQKQADLVLANNSGSSSQKFQLINNSDGSFRILSAGNTSLAMDTNPSSNADAILWSVNGTDCQNFVAVANGNGSYSIRLASNPDSALTAVNGDVRLAAYTGANTQAWQLNTPINGTAMVSQKLQSVMNTYPHGTSLGSGYRFANASQCMGFGREVFYRLFGQVASWGYDGSPKSSSDAQLYTITASSSSYSASSMKNLISKAKPGDILQMNSPKMHTMVFVSSDANGFTVYDANWIGSNVVSVRYVKYGAWATRNSKGITLLHANAYPD